jgi:hypothetical protein
MAISIDRVYQKVLAIANKEQRGYITPQEFNLFADQAQIEIFEQYFYDINQWNRTHGNSMGHSDMKDMLESKISAFELWARTPNANLLNNFGDLDLEQFANFYRLIEVRVNYNDGTGYHVAEEMTAKEFRNYDNSPLTKQTKNRPIYLHFHDGYDRIKIYPHPPQDTYTSNSGVIGDDVRISYIKKPSKPNWTYIVSSNQTALYNPTAPDAKDFELHPSDEPELVYRILALAGISLQRPEITQTASALETAKLQQEKQ